jgi:hypothetical protein
MITALDLAYALLDPPGRIMEIEGKKNRSPVIDEINALVGIPDGSPYCAAGVSLLFRAIQQPEKALAKPHLASLLGRQAVLLQRQEHSARRLFPFSGSSQAIMRAFRADGKTFTDPQHLLDCRGALGGWTNPDGEHGHIFLVTGRLTARSKVLGVRTAEFNSNPHTKGRDGEGAYLMERSIDELRATHPRFWFADLTGMIGGEYWPA